MATSPTADVSVRLAWADDAEAVARLQLAAWAVRYPDVRDTVPGEAEVAEAWRSALARPHDARHRLLVALERNRVVGFVVTTPSTDPDSDPVADGELSDLTVAPDEVGRGHGSRLLQAAVDTLRADRFERAVTWLLATDDVLRRFVADAGWAPDGAHRELDLDGSGATTVRQVRLHTTL